MSFGLIENLSLGKEYVTEMQANLIPKPTQAQPRLKWWV